MQRIRLLLAATLCALGYGLLQVPDLSPLAIQSGLAGLFLAGIAFEARVATHPFFLLPPAIFSTFCFLNNMVAGIYYFAANRGLETQFAVNDASILRGTWYTLVAVEALWVGFHAMKDFHFKAFQEMPLRPLPRALPLGLVAVSLATFVMGVQMGIYGYIADPEKVKYLSYLRFGINLGILAIILIAVYEFDLPKRRRLLYGLVALYILIGLLYGSKSTAVLPILLVAVSLYATGRKIGLRFVVAIALCVGLSYVVVEPFRVYHARIENEQQVRSVGALVDMFAQAQALSGEMDLHYSDYSESFLERFSYVVPLAKSLEFADDRTYYHSEEWGHLALSPLYGLIPRLLWKDKPTYEFGAWASVHIFDLPPTTHTGITPQGYAYLVGRLPAVLVFFLLYGLVQRLMFNLLFLHRAFIPFYLVMILDIGYPVSPWTFVAGSLQNLLLMAPLLLLVHRWHAVRREPCQA